MPILVIIAIIAAFYLLAKRLIKYHTEYKYEYTSAREEQKAEAKRAIHELENIEKELYERKDI